MKINETSFKFSGSLGKRSKTNRVILHHAAASCCTANQIHTCHLNNGWAGIGYHYYIRKDGGIYRGRPENTVGAHAGNNNSDSIGICFEGNFEIETMPAVQQNAGAELIANILSRYGSLSLLRHRDVNSTACPGKNFPFQSMISGKSSANTGKDTGESAARSTPCGILRSGDKGNGVIWLQKSLTAKGYLLSADGIFGKKTLAAVKDLQTAFCLSADGLVGDKTKAALLSRTPGDPYAPVPSANLKSGSKGSGVKWLQKALIMKGYSLGKYGVDGTFGSETRAAVLLFQKASKLAQDGIAGKNTRGKLLA